MLIQCLVLRQLSQRRVRYPVQWPRVQRAVGRPVLAITSALRVSTCGSVALRATPHSFKLCKVFSWSFTLRAGRSILVATNCRSAAGDRVASRTRCGRIGKYQSPSLPEPRHNRQRAARVPARRNSARYRTREHIRRAPRVGFVSISFNPLKVSISLTAPRLR